MKRADYIYKISDRLVEITDLNLGGISVTNDAENVLTEINSEENIENLAVIYKDSEGDWCELIPSWNNHKCDNVKFNPIFE